jgi:hypothetical protein
MQQFLYFTLKRLAVLALAGRGDGIALTVWRGTSKTNHINLLRDILRMSWPGSRGPAFA